MRNCIHLKCFFFHFTLIYTSSPSRNTVWATFIIKSNRIAMKRIFLYPSLFLVLILSCMSAVAKTVIIAPHYSTLSNVFDENFKDKNLDFYPRDGACHVPDSTQISDYVRNIIQDKQGNLWFGSNAYGAIRYNGDTLSYFSVYQGLVGHQITDMMEDNQGALWFSSYGGVSKYDGSAFTNYTVLDGLTDPWVWSIFQDSRGTIWAGTLEGLCRFEDNKFKAFPIPYVNIENTKSTLKPKMVQSIIEDNNGDLWFATDGLGVYKYNGEQFYHYTTDEGLCDNSITCIVEDSKGNYWFGSAFGGLSKYDGTSFTTINDANGIGSNEVSHIYEDKKGYVWFSSEGYGVYRYDGKNLRNYNEEEGLNVSAVQSIFEDKEGRFWVGGGGGLYRLDGQNFVNVKRTGPWE